MNPAPPADFAFTISLEMPRKKKEDSSFGARLAVLRRARALAVSTDELPGLKNPSAAPAHEEDCETRPLSKRFPVVTQLPEQDQRAVIGLINSLAAVAPRRHSIGGERNAR